MISASRTTLAAGRRGAAAGLIMEGYGRRIMTSVSDGRGGPALQSVTRNAGPRWSEISLRYCQAGVTLGRAVAELGEVGPLLTALEMTILVGSPVTPVPPTVPNCLVPWEC